MLNFSNYLKDPKYYSTANNLVVGKMKDETCDVSIKVFVGLKSKMYTYVAEDMFKRTKGVSNKDVDDELKLEDYKNKKNSKQTS